MEGFHVMFKNLRIIEARTKGIYHFFLIWALDSSLQLSVYEHIFGKCLSYIWPKKPAEILP